MDERKLELGKCMPSGARCVFDCDSVTAVCPNPSERCAFDATAMFTGSLTWEVNDTPPSSCSLSLTLKGEKTDGTEFTASESTTAFCNQEFPCGQNGFPRPNPFFCVTDGVRLDEEFLPHPYWLTFSKFTSGIASQIQANFPAGSGEPIIVKVEDCEAVVDNHTNSNPTRAHFCIKGYLVRSFGQQAPSCTSGGTSRPCPCP